MEGDEVLQQTIEIPEDVKELVHHFDVVGFFLVGSILSHQIQQCLLLVLLQQGIHHIDGQVFYRCTCLTCLPSGIGCKLCADSCPILFAEGFLACLDGYTLEHLELSCPSRIDRSGEVEYILSGNAGNRISSDFFTLGREVFTTDGFDTGSLYIECQRAVRREASQLITHEEVLHLAVQSLISCNDGIGLVAERSRNFGCTPVGISLQVGVELLDLWSCHALYTTSVHGAACLGDSGGDGIDFFCIVAAGRGDDTIAIEAGLGKNGRNICRICQRDARFVLTQIGQNLLGCLAQLQPFFVFYIDFIDADRILSFQQQVRILEHLGNPLGNTYHVVDTNLAIRIKVHVSQTLFIDFQSLDGARQYRPHLGVQLVEVSNVLSRRYSHSGTSANVVKLPFVLFVSF